MGNFYTTVQVLDNQKLGSKRFTEEFCKKMADAGYAVCGSDECEQSYILHFAENSSWIAIASEEYTSDGQKVREDAPRFAKMLKAPCVTTNVIDSDCAVMDVYGATGKKLDTLIMGRADDYFGDDYPAPSEKIWGMFLADGTTWERFMEVRNGDYTFVEDGLAELAPLIGMDSSNIGFTSEDAIADDDTVFLYFKSAGKKPKKLTLNAAFKQVFGQALEPLGFKLVKSKHPYFARLVGDEILHVISVVPRADNRFEIVGGVATVYRQKISFDNSPKLEYGWWLEGISTFYHNLTGSEFQNKYSYYEINEFSANDSLVIQMEKALAATKDIILNILNGIDTLEKCIYFYSSFKLDIRIRYMNDFGNCYPANYFNEGLLLIKSFDLDAYTIFNNKQSEICLLESKQQIARGIFSEDKYPEFVKEAEKYRIQRLEFYKNVLADKEWINNAMKELEKRKKHNIDELKKCGVFTETPEPPKPKNVH